MPGTVRWEKQARSPAAVARAGTVRSVRDARGRGEGTSQPPAPRERQDEARAPRGTRRPWPVPVALGRPAPPHSALPSALLRRPHLREHVVSFLPLSRHTCRSLGSPRPVERIPALSKIPALGRRRRASRRASRPGPPPRVRDAFSPFGFLLSVWLPHHTLPVTPFALFSLPSFIRSLVTESPVGARRRAKCQDRDTRTEADEVLALARLAVWRRKSQTWPPGLCTNKHLGA